LTITKGFSDQGYLRSEITLIDSDAWPDTREQFVLGDDFAGALNQHNQEVERTSTDVNWCVSLKQQLGRGPQAKWPKPDRAVNRWRLRNQN
jgi:hypothetical protein